MKTLWKDGSIREGNFEEKEIKQAFWHTSAHILAQAVKRLYPDTKCGIGPAIENGFYYDFKVEKPLTEEEVEYLKIRLIYPEKFWKIVNFYYNSGKAWIPGKNLEKLQKLVDQEKKKQEFLSKFKNTYKL